MSELKLSLFKAPFDVMVTGEKTIEVRTASEWILSRLKANHPEVRFTHGYGKERPYFISQLMFWYYEKEQHTIKYSTGFEVVSKPGDIILVLSKPSIICYPPYTQLFI